MSLADEIKNHVDIVEIIGEHVELRRSGKNYIGFCPFHPNTRTPAFVVFPDTQTWRCFGACDTGGDVFTFLMKKEGWDFRQALQYLAERAGIPLKEYGPRAAGQTTLWRQLLEEAVTLYRHFLLSSQGKAVLAYLEGRGLTRPTIEAFGLGYAPGNDVLVPYFVKKGIAPGHLVEVGLAREREDTGEVHDLFHRRIMFPIRDAQGHTVGFGARTLDPEGFPKYINSPATPLFDKGRLLYGLDRARSAIRRRGRAILVEGYMDVLALHQAGFEEAVSPMGTALTREQLRQLQRYARRVYLALDPDLAGEKALWRSLEVAREAATTEEPVLDARGLLQYEQRLQLDMRVVALPEGKDPDEIVLDDPEHWARLLDEAQPLLLYLMARKAQEMDLKDAKGRAQMVTLFAPLIRMVANPAERQAYWEALAEYVHTPVEVLQRWRPRVQGTSGAVRPASQPATALQTLSGPLAYPVSNPHLQERYLLALFWHDPDMLPLVLRRLRELGEPPLSEADFEDPLHRTLWQGLTKALEQIDVPPQAYLERFVEATPPLWDLIPVLEALYRPVAETLQRVSRRVQEACATVLGLRRFRITQAIQHMEALLQEAADAEMEARLQFLLQRRRNIETAVSHLRV